MFSFIIFRLLRRRRLKFLTRSRVFFVALFFTSMWIVNALFFYYSEHVVAGRGNVDLWTSLYWSLITMATIGYGDVTPVKGLGWIVAGFAAIMGIVAYTLTVSVIADWFLSKSIRRSLGMAPLKNKKILVIGGTDTCREIIDELILNGYGDDIGWISPKQPRGVIDIEYLVGDPSSENTLVKAGIRDAEHAYLCLGDDSKTLHVALLVKHLNPRINIYAVVLSSETEELLREAGVKHAISTRILGRTIASALFEPLVLDLLSDIVSTRGLTDLVEYKAGKNTTVEKLEEELNSRDKCYKYRVLMIARNNEKILLPEKDTSIVKNDRVVLLKAYQCKS